VVAKLFHIVAPDKAFFGQKDAAQVAVLRRMVRDLNFDLELIVCPTVREPDGLALSSRNRYLSAEERACALVLSKALNIISAAYRAGQKNVTILLEAGRNAVAAEREVRIDYLQIVDWDTLLPLTEARAGALVAIAAHVGSTRLIDNTLLE
jgi:pantoate--beta-alanine ligase